MFFDFLAQKPIFVGVNLGAGRFNPLANQELNLLMFFAPSGDFQAAAAILCAFNAAIFAALFGVIFCLAARVANPKTALLAVLIIFVNLGFVVIITGICYPEKMQSLVLALFVAAAYGVFIEGRNGQNRLVRGILCVALGVLSLFFKETDFIFIGTFGAAWLILANLYGKSGVESGGKNGAKSMKSQRNVAFILLGGAIIFVAAYAMFVLPNVTKSYTATHGQSGILLLKEAANAFLNHPFIFILLPILAGFRIAEVVGALRAKRQIAANLAFFDALLLGALAYGFAYFALKLFSAYYFFPCYVMGFLPCVAYARRARLAFAATLVLHLAMNVPLAASTYTATKILPPHYGRAMAFLADYSAGLEREGGGVNIFMLGQSRDADGLMFYDFLARFVGFFGGRGFDLKTNKENPSGVIPRKDSPFSIFNSLEVSEPKTGDLLYLDMHGKDFVDGDYLAALGARYELIFASEYFGFYNLNLKSLAKFALRESALGKSYNALNRVSGNIFRAPLGVYIYRVK